MIPVSFKVAENGHIQLLRGPRSIQLQLLVKYVLTIYHKKNLSQVSKTKLNSMV
jgi:hypothetical protein